MFQPSKGDTFPNVGAECAAGVAGIVGALGEVAASGTLAMTSCKEFPMAGVANGKRMGVDNAHSRTQGMSWGWGVGFANEKMPLLQLRSLAGFRADSYNAGGFRADAFKTDTRGSPTPAMSQARRG